jgi:hypothetical protein
MFIPAWTQRGRPSISPSGRSFTVTSVKPILDPQPPQNYQSHCEGDKHQTPLPRFNPNLIPNSPRASPPVWLPVPASVWLQPALRVFLDSDLRRWYPLPAPAWKFPAAIQSANRSTDRFHPLLCSFCRSRTSISWSCGIRCVRSWTQENMAAAVRSRLGTEVSHR